MNNDSSFYLFQRLFGDHIKLYSKKIIWAILFMIIVAAANATHVYMIKPILDEIFFKHDSTMLAIIPCLVILIAIIKAVCSYYQNYYMKFVGQRIITDIQTRLYQHLVKSDIGYLNASSSGILISKFTNDISMLRNSMTNFLTGIVKELFTLIFLIGVMVSLSLTLSIITFVVFPLAIFPIIKMGRKMRRISTKTQEELGNYTAKLDDTFQTIKIVKSFLREDYEINKAKNMLESIFSLYVKAIKAESLSSPIMEILSGIAVAAVVWYGGLQVVNGSTSPGSFFVFISSFIAAYKPIKCLADLNSNLQQGLSSAKRLFTILDENPKITDLEGSSPLSNIDGAIEVSHVKFSYTESDQGLDNVSLKIKPGETIAFVGKSGSGKSTILNLLLRFYESNEGTISIDGHNIFYITLESLRENISYVSQEVMLFDNSIAANIEYGLLGATKEQVIAAAKAADAHDFIKNLPNGYDTLIGQNGHKLSGGQKQRISIARALIKNAPILIFDEATSSLDNISEREIFNNLKKIRHGKTNIIVAHRLSTIIDADEIIVFKNGKIAQKGTHIDLLKDGGEYAKLYQASLESEN